MLYGLACIKKPLWILESVNIVYSNTCMIESTLRNRIFKTNTWHNPQTCFQCMLYIRSQATWRICDCVREFSVKRSFTNVSNVPFVDQFCEAIQSNIIHLFFLLHSSRTKLGKILLFSVHSFFYINSNSSFWYKLSKVLWNIKTTRLIVFLLLHKMP